MLLLTTNVGVAKNVQQAGRVRCVVTNVKDEVVRSQLENTLSLFVTELNTAFMSGREPEIESRLLSGEVKKELLDLWENSPLVYRSDRMYVNAVRETGGWEVRRILLDAFAVMDKDNQQRELVMHLDDSCRITQLRFALPKRNAVEIVNSELTISDLNRRQKVLEVVEQLYTAFYQKDIDFIRSIFQRENALLINLESQNLYLNRLDSLFRSHKKIGVAFEQIKIERHPVYTELYGVNVLQNCFSRNYNEKGWLFFVIDFKQDQSPLVHVRAWQPIELNGTAVNIDHVLGLSDFNFVQ